MKSTFFGKPYHLALCLWAAALLLPFLATAASSNQRLPEIIEAGFAVWAKGGGIDAIMMSWQRGGVMEGSNKAATVAQYIRSLAGTLGSYKSHEMIQSKSISQSSQVIYLCVNFERGIVYGRLLMYHTDKHWVVQNMDFNERPEAIMPWLAYEAGIAQQ